MTNVVPMSRLLRLAFLADAAASGATAALLVASADFLEGRLGEWLVDGCHTYGYRPADVNCPH